MLLSGIKTDVKPSHHHTVYKTERCLLHEKKDREGMREAVAYLLLGEWGDAPPLCLL